MTGRAREKDEKDKPPQGNAAVVAQLTRIADALERAYPPPPPPLPVEPDPEPAQLPA